MTIKWLTPAGLIGSFAEEEYVEFQLDAYDSGGSPLTFTVIAGDVTSGLQLFKSGLLQGIPVIEQTSTTTDTYSQSFTVRATNAYGKISDRTFDVIINSIALPQIIPKNVSLGTYYDGFYLNLQLQAVDPNPIANLQWTILEGELPPGVVMDSAGHITGFIEPFVSAEAETLLNWSNAKWDSVSWDCPTAIAQSKTYRFKVQVFDGARYDLSVYTIFVQAKSLFTVDNTLIPVNTDILTADLDNKHRPYITTLPQELPEQRQESNFAFQFQGVDLDGGNVRYAVVLSGQAAFDQGPTLMDPTLPQILFDEVPFDQNDDSLPDGVSLDNVTGWMTGNLAAQVEERKTYTFKIYCYKEDDPSAVSDPVTFTLTVLGSLDNVVNWETASDLGYLDNGTVSELFIKASSSKGKQLNYRIKEALANPDDLNPANLVVKYTTLAKSKLPQGIKLLPDGMLVGRSTFEYFSLDGGTTTLDKGKISFDYEFKFTVTASDESAPGIPVDSPDYKPATISSDKTFSIRINNYNKLPFENVYLKALPTRKQRVDFQELLSNTDIFPDPLIYRPTDPWFGKAKDIKFLFAAGMNPNTAKSYVESMKDHHFNKRVSLGNVKTAVALDANYKVKYEVVYVEVLDPEDGVAYSVDRTSQVTSQYRTPPFSVVYPNSFGNMKKELSNLGYSNRGALPDWMLNQQEDGTVLGFTRGVILAYTVPGASKLIAYRLGQNKVTFNDIDFVADRYQLDHLLSKTYDIENHKFLESKETTFDRLIASGDLHPYAGTAATARRIREDGAAAGLSTETIESLVTAATQSMSHIAVNYAVNIPFDEINGRTVEYLISAGGLDGVATIQNGQYLVFARQEFYSRTTESDKIIKDPFDINNFDHLEFDAGIEPKQYDTPNDGWNIEYGLYGATNYAETSYAPTGVVPGYQAMIGSAIYDQQGHIIGYGTTNQRAGIWKILVNDDGLVTLEFVVETALNEYVQVKNGRTYGDTKLYYDPVVGDNETVPSFSILSSKVHNSTEFTRFDMSATRFFSFVDMYAEPETEDIYLKFPKFNIYQ